MSIVRMRPLLSFISRAWDSNLAFVTLLYIFVSSRLNRLTLDLRAMVIGKTVQGALIRLGALLVCFVGCLAIAAVLEQIYGAANLGLGHIAAVSAIVGPLFFYVLSALASLNKKARGHASSSMAKAWTVPGLAVLVFVTLSIGSHISFLSPSLPSISAKGSTAAAVGGKSRLERNKSKIRVCKEMIWRDSRRQRPCVLPLPLLPLSSLPFASLPLSLLPRSMSLPASPTPSSLHARAW